ncbi:acetyl-CoA carboxylase, carboxyltransferase subunit beta [Erysipelotrichaceae bacterium HCN-30851]
MEQLFKVRKKRLDLFKKRRTQSIVEPVEAPENVFKSCPNCSKSILFEDLMHNLYVCPHCGHHLKLTAHERLRQIVDENSFVEMDRRLVLTEDQLQFPGYEEKLSRLQKKTGLYEAVVCGVGSIGGHKTAIAVMDSNFFMGSMGQIVGEKITRCIEYATKKKLPLLIFSTSGGARMQEGILSLVQMAKTSSALAKHNDAGLLYISYFTHPTTGGVSASFAMLGDIILSEPDCLIGFAGKRVIASTVKEELPKNFQKAEFLLEKGFIDAIVERKDSRETLIRILNFHERRSS